MRFNIDIYMVQFYEFYTVISEKLTTKSCNKINTFFSDMKILIQNVYICTKFCRKGFKKMIILCKENTP